MTLTNVLETIHALNLSASVGNGQCIVVFHGDGSPPSFVRAKRDGDKHAAEAGHRLHRVAGEHHQPEEEERRFEQAIRHASP